LYAKLILRNINLYHFMYVYFMYELDISYSVVKFVHRRSSE